MKIYSMVVILPILLLTGCGGCSRSARRLHSRRYDTVPRRTDGRIGPGEKNVVKIEKTDGVYYIPIDIDEVPMHFIFDTGAATISISETEAIFLYKQGKLTSDDIKGSANFSDANGNITEGTVINLKSVRIGNRVLENVQASVVRNMDAPLLFGESALEKFGKVSIDYNKMEISFE